MEYQILKAPKIKILVGEDDIVSADVIKLLFKQRSCVVDIVSSGEQFIKQIGKKNYNFALINVELDEINGFETTRIIRERNDTHSNIPIILLTSDPYELCKDRAIEVGIDGYIAKPLTAKKRDVLLKDIKTRKFRRI